MPRTRMRGNRSDWDTLSPGRRAVQLVSQKALVRGLDSLTDAERAIYDRGLETARQGRAKPVQHESAHARIFAARAHRHWWAKYLTRVEHRTADWREAEARMVEGAKTGMPDFWLFVPAAGTRQDGLCNWCGYRLAMRGDCTSAECPVRGAILAVCELKAPQHAPKRETTREWWLGEWPEGQQSWHGLRRDQHWWLRNLAGCGFETCVAYGHDQAEAFFVGVAGESGEIRAQAES